MMRTQKSRKDQGLNMPAYALKCLSATIASTVLLAACSQFEPKPYTQDEMRQRVIEDQARMYKEQEPVNGPITFYEA